MRISADLPSQHYFEGSCHCAGRGLLIRRPLFEKRFDKNVSIRLRWLPRKILLQAPDLGAFLLQQERSKVEVYILRRCGCTRRT